MSGKRKDLKVNQLVDQYLKRSKELDERLDDIGKEIEAHAERVAKKQELEGRLRELADYIEDAQSSIEGLRSKFHNATFNQDQEAIEAIQAKRTELLADIDQYALDQKEAREQLNAVIVDGASIAEICAELDAGIRTPDYKEFLKVLAADCKARKAAQEKRLKELRSTVPSQFKNQQAYDAARKSLDKSYRTAEESKAAAQARQRAIEEERRRFNQHQPKSSNEIRRQKDSAFAKANQAPVPAHEW